MRVESVFRSSQRTVQLCVGSARHDCWTAASFLVAVNCGEHGRSTRTNVGSTKKALDRSDVRCTSTHTFRVDKQVTAVLLLSAKCQKQVQRGVKHIVHEFEEQVSGGVQCRFESNNRLLDSGR